MGNNPRVLDCRNENNRLVGEKMRRAIRRTGSNRVMTKDEDREGQHGTAVKSTTTHFFLCWFLYSGCVAVQGVGSHVYSTGWPKGF